MAGAQPVVVFWYGWGIHVMVVLSFLVQGTRWPTRRAIYALGHMSVVSRSREHHLMALWAPLLLVHLGGQDNITAYAIEDNRLWLRHLQTFVLQVLAAAYVLYSSSIFSQPSLLRSATILMFIVGVLKYGERVWSLRGGDNYASSSLAPTSYKDLQGEQKEQAAPKGQSRGDPGDEMLVITAHSLLHVPKQMFKGPTRYVKNKSAKTYSGEYMSKVVEMQLSMMYDLLYTKAAVVHTVCGVCIRVISLTFTVAALLMFHSMRPREEGAGYKRADVTITNVLLIGAVVLEAMSTLRAVFSLWTVALLSEKKWHKAARMIASTERRLKLLVRSGAYWSGYMRQHNMLHILLYTTINKPSKIARRMGRDDWWDSMFYSSCTRVPEALIDRVLELVSTRKNGEVGNIGRAQGLNAVGRSKEEELVTLIKGMKLELADSILVWHIATEIYISWYYDQYTAGLYRDLGNAGASHRLSRYMVYLLAARPYMLPYPVTRQSYVQLCHDYVTQLEMVTSGELQAAILEQKDALMRGSSFQIKTKITHNNTSEQPSINITLDKGCQLTATLIHRAEGNADGIMEMIFQVWVEMLCFAAYGCNEKSHAGNLINGGDIMTIVALMMVYSSNGFIKRNKKPNKDTGAPAKRKETVPPITRKKGAGSTSSGGGVEATD
ncbi:unnamed protein product [Alopecurus aequalis]